MALGWKILIGLLLVGALIAGERTWEQGMKAKAYKQGYDAADGEWKLKEAKITADAEEKVRAAGMAALRLERSLRDQFDATMAQRDTKEKEYETRIADLQSAARSAALRLSIAIDRSSLSGCAAAADPAVATGTGGEARADLMPEAAAAAIGIAGDSAKDVRDYNRLVDLYNDARKTCNAVGESPKAVE